MNEETSITLPGKGEFKLNSLLEAIKYARLEKWKLKKWKPSPALVDKAGKSSGAKFIGQNFDPKYFTVTEKGWTHDHCEICFTTICENPEAGQVDGYNSENDNWICKDCYNLFIEPADVNQTINRLRTENS